MAKFHYLRPGFEQKIIADLASDICRSKLALGPGERFFRRQGRSNGIWALLAGPEFIPQVKPISRLRFDYDTTTIRRYHDAFDYDGSDRNYDLRSIRLRYDYDPTTTKNRHGHFCLRQIASNGSRRWRARYVVVGS